MSYRPPGVEFTQVQDTLNVSAVISDLMSGIVGPAYNVVELGDFNYSYISVNASGVDAGKFTVNLSGLDDVNLELDEDSIYAEFLARTGETIPFTGTKTVSGNTVKFTADSAIFTHLTDAVPSGTNPDMRQYKPRIAYRALYTKRNHETAVTVLDDVLYSAGKFSTINPLGFAAYVMLLNSPASFMIYPTVGTADGDFTDAFESLANSDVYAVAPLSQVDDVFASAKTWALDRSLPANSRPTKIYFSPKTVWFDDNGNQLTGGNQLAADPGFDVSPFEFPLYKLSKTSKLKTAEGIAAASAQILERRISRIHPDLGWVLESRHFLQTDPTYVQATSDVEGGECVLASTITLVDGTVCLAGTVITADVFNTFKPVSGVQNLTNFTLNVYTPVAGYYLAVQQAALVSALNPSDPKTQQPVSGIAKLDFSENFFGSDYTNVIAGGGTNVIVQPTLSVLPASRHHLTTDMSSIQTAEDNILHQLDVVTINFRIALKPLTGRYKQNARYYKLLRATLNAYAEAFKLKEYALDIQIVEVKQSITEPDKILVTMRVLPYYAANYIDVTILY